MPADLETKVWYRIYVLFILLVVCVSSLASRNLPSYLVTVPVPECEETCQGVELQAPLCGDNVLEKWPTETSPTPLELCKLCMNRVTPPAGTSFATLASTSKAWKRMRDALDDNGGLGSDLGLAELRFPWPPVGFTSNSSSDLTHRVPIPWVDESLNATFYNMADGACLYHWEYGILIGYGFALFFALGAVPAGKICDSRSRVEVASIALIVWSVATSMQAAAHNFWFLLGCRMAIGASQAFAMPAAISLTADYFHERQSCAVEILSVGLHLGSGCASFSILFAEVVGWRWAVFIAGLFGIAIAPVLYGTVREPARTEWSAPCGITIVTDEVFEKSRVARMLVFAGSAKMLAAYSLSAFMPIWYSRRGLDGYTNYTYACWNALVISSGGVLSAMFGSFLNYHWSKFDWRAPCWIGVMGSVLAVPLLCIVFLSSHFWVSMMSFFFLLLVSEGWYGPALSCVQASVRRSVRGQAVSMFMMVPTLIGNLGPALVGFLDPGDAGIGTHLLWICIVANVAAATAFTWTAREITIDPVAAGLGSKREEIPSGAASRAGFAQWALF